MVVNLRQQDIRVTPIYSLPKKYGKKVGYRISARISNSGKKIWFDPVSFAESRAKKDLDFYKKDFGDFYYDYKIEKVGLIKGGAWRKLGKVM